MPFEMKKQVFNRPGPRASKELRRIIDLPRRDPFEVGGEIAEVLSEELSTEAGTQTLRPLQALALAEAASYGGAVVLMAVGEGKTLVSFLLPTVMQVKKALLLVPAKLKKKTEIEFQELEKHWQKHKKYKIESYEMISRQPALIKNYKPQLIVADESHRLKNKKSGVTKRVWKYWYENKNIHFVPMSGTLASRSFFDWWHLQLMAMPDYMGVLPYHWKEAEHWSDALDEKTKNRCSLGALSFFGNDIQSAREGFGNHIRQVPGIIASKAQSIGTSIYVERHDVYSPIIKEAESLLINKWELPDGTLITRAADWWRHAKELGNGFFYRWKEEGPQEWMDARREANAVIRKFLHGSRKCETPAQAREVLKDHEAIKKWTEIEDTFKPQTEAVWLTFKILEYAASLSGREDSLLWYEHKAVGQALMENCGLQVFGAEALNICTGEHIYTAGSGKACAVSIGSCSEGLNLQKWSSNIILSPPALGKRWEQIIGRTHRPGQKADTVNIHVIEAVQAQSNDFKQALADARYIQGVTGQSQKLMLADSAA